MHVANPATTTLSGGRTHPKALGNEPRNLNNGRDLGLRQPGVYIDISAVARSSFAVTRVRAPAIRVICGPTNSH